MRLGVLAFQGAVSEHVEMLNRAMDELDLEGSVEIIKGVHQLENLDGIVLPGGESTVIGRLCEKSGLIEIIKRRVREGMGIFATCAGIILLSKEAYDIRYKPIQQPLLKVLDIGVIRNVWGRQRESFETWLEIAEIGREPFRGVFIRAPGIDKLYDTKIKVLASYENKPVAVEKSKIIATTFHPELTEDTRMHKYFIRKLLSNQSS